MMIEFELLDKESVFTRSSYPHKTDKVTQLLVLKGEVSFIIDFNTYNLQAPAMVLFFPGQVIEAVEASSDSEIVGMAFAPELTAPLNLPVSLQEKLKGLTPEQLKALIAMVKKS